MLTDEMRSILFKKLLEEQKEITINIGEIYLDKPIKEIIPKITHATVDVVNIVNITGEPVRVVYLTPPTHSGDIKLWWIKEIKKVFQTTLEHIGKAHLFEKLEIFHEEDSVISTISFVPI